MGWIRDPEENYPGSRGQKAPDPGAGSATLHFYHNWNSNHARVTEYRAISSNVFVTLQEHG